MNFKNLCKYIIQVILVSIASYCLSPCDVKIPFALSIGLISATIFVILDMYYPMIVYDKKNNTGDGTCFKN